MQYTPLIDIASTNDSTITIDKIDNTRPVLLDHFCRPCKTKLIKKQQTNHTPMECLSQRCELLEDEVIRLKDRDIKSRLHIQELEAKMIALENAVKGLTAPIQLQATPFSFGNTKKHRNPLTKSHSADLPEPKSKINYDHILQQKPPTNRERVGLFGSLGASSQQP